MDDLGGHTIVTKDALEEILRETDYGKKLLKRVVKNEFGLPIYISNVTLISIIRDNKNEEDFPKILRNLRKYAIKVMPYDRRRKRTGIFQDIHVSHTPWESARRWYVIAAIDKTLLNESLQKIDILVLCDIALTEANKQIDQILIKDNPYYELIKRLARHDKRFPNFFIKS